MSTILFILGASAAICLLDKLTGTSLLDEVDAELDWIDEEIPR